VASTSELATKVMMVYSGDGTARAGGVKGQLEHSARWRQTELASVLMARRWSERWPAMITSLADHGRGRES
jgi:hypothetical protein